jgi:hypothetical protein
MTNLFCNRARPIYTVIAPSSEVVEKLKKVVHDPNARTCSDKNNIHSISRANSQERERETRIYSLLHYPATSHCMAKHLTPEYRGFLKFVSAARDDLSRWFGSYCDNDPARIAFLTAREWDGMADLERKPFIKSSQTGKVSSVNPYVKYLLHSRYTGNASFDPKSAKQLALRWRSMSPEEKLKFSELNPLQSAIEFVIRQRDQLHQAYHPKKLCLLEFMLKTKPRWPLSARLWYFRHEAQSLGSKEARQRWLMLNDEERAIYNRCALLDRKRYDFEKNAWMTKILTIDLDADDFTLNDFSIPEIKNRIDSLGSLVEVSRDLPNLIGLKRPRSPFSLFIEAYRYQIRDERPEFQFGRHLKECSEAWYQLKDEEKDFYKSESKKLKDKQRDLLSKESCNGDSRLTLPIDLFSTAKSSMGPCRPSHLYPRVLSPFRIYCKEIGSKTASKDLKELWSRLSDAEKEIYVKRHEQMKESCLKKKREIDNKLKEIKELLKCAAKLEDLKQQLRLIGNSSKVVKNLYN